MNPELLFRLERVEADPGAANVARMEIGPWCFDDAGEFDAGSLAVGVDGVLGAMIHLAGSGSDWTVTSELTVDCFADPETTAQYIQFTSRLFSLDDAGGAATCEITTDRGQVVGAGLVRSRFVPPLPKMPDNVRLPSRADLPADASEPKSVLDAIGGRLEVSLEASRLVVAANPALKNFSGVLHGGIVATASSCVGLAALDREVSKRVARLSVCYLRPVPIDDEAAFDAVAVHNGRSFGVAEAVSRNEHGRPLSIATVTAYERK
ncbi:MAG: PaaI family thioesterase [Aldersonia sp.]|nr:PaaI family thioesterase [Aldersonia sp.]